MKVQTFHGCCHGYTHFRRISKCKHRYLTYFTFYIGAGFPFLRLYTKLNMENWLRIDHNFYTFRPVVFSLSFLCQTNNEIITRRFTKIVISMAQNIRNVLIGVEIFRINCNTDNIFKMCISYLQNQLFY